MSITVYTINNNRRFEWNTGKAWMNTAKHGISFAEAATIFDDPQGKFEDDPKHSRQEHRRRLIGESAFGQILVVSFTIRAGPTIRLISARPANRNERRQYHG